MAAVWMERIANNHTGGDMIEPTDLFLVAVVNHPRDLEFARLLGWYRIPLRHAPKVVRVDGLAFYLTADFGAEKWSIRYAAKVRGVELVRRIDLLQEESGHPRAMEEYYKLQLGALFPLPRAIPARGWKRITFLYTTGARLLSAESVEDLAIHGTEQQLLWGALRERAGGGDFGYGEDFSAWRDAMELFLGWSSESE
jgi:hypothetical protein